MADQCSRYRSFGRSIKEKGYSSFTELQEPFLSMISEWPNDCLKDMYHEFDTGYLESEMTAWHNAGHERIVNVLRQMISLRK